MLDNQLALQAGHGVFTNPHVEDTGLNTPFLRLRAPEFQLILAQGTFSSCVSPGCSVPRLKPLSCPTGRDAERCVAETVSKRISGLLDWSQQREVKVGRSVSPGNLHDFIFRCCRRGMARDVRT
jgi:hypothetical protein